MPKQIDNYNSKRLLRQATVGSHSSNSAKLILVVVSREGILSRCLCADFSPSPAPPGVNCPSAPPYSYATGLTLLERIAPITTDLTILVVIGCETRKSI